ncbi:secretory pathway Sec39 [Aureobasidium pullulans]|uniref:Secretory pathway Sec39 n=1 Tax=Aureobasidium pullulans TaxID=5580 RepID=A0A4S9IY72_AURPU|nr:secretory pathway Sec39 [Aureobasidium pullulans]THX19722.1 secretory pathway Sec39 [Aureobasidium pullulans]THX93008.1 secretory pathway Sec39 [Aureobasidium pullulans]TIA43971.1 secretory pathway Sec39 [Aureobasidium pullulans]TIA82116.1 secretory pathway Sec39 [Aureobasidium pullulans]
MAGPEVNQLSSAQCILLTVHYASEANIRALYAFTPLRLDVLSPELVLRIVLSYLPETVDPSLYTTYVREVATRIYLEQQEPLKVDPSPVTSLSPEQAQRRVNKLNISDLSPPAFPPHAPNDLLTRFVIHRANRIDSETGLLTLVPRLAEPFLDTNEYIRTWYVAVVLPLLRFRYEYYPDTKDPPTLPSFEKLDGQHGIDLLLSNVTHVDHEITSSTESEGIAARDTRAMVGPWMYGHTERKRRRLYNKKDDKPDVKHHDQDTVRSPPRTAFIKLDGVSKEDKTGHDWEYVFEWMVHNAVDDFAVVTNLIEEWDEPDVLLRPEHPLATPKLETYMLLQMMVYSAYQLAGLGHSISILNVAKLRFFATQDEQLALLLKIVHGLAAKGKRDDHQWQHDYDKLIWLWNWNIELEDEGLTGAGIFGHIEKTTIEREFLKVLVSNGCESDDDLASDVERMLHIFDD